MAYVEYIGLMTTKEFIVAFAAVYSVVIAAAFLFAWAVFAASDWLDYRRYLRKREGRQCNRPSCSPRFWRCWL